MKIRAKLLENKNKNRYLYLATFSKYGVDFRAIVTSTTNLNVTIIDWDDVPIVAWDDVRFINYDNVNNYNLFIEVHKGDLDNFAMRTFQELAQW